MTIPAARGKYCTCCQVAARCFLSRMPARAVRALCGARRRIQCPKGTILFAQGEKPTGAFLVCGGRVTLFVASASGKSVLLRTARPGDIVGLSAAVTGKKYDVTAQTESPARVLFISRSDFRGWMRRHNEGCLQVVAHLSRDVQSAYERVRALAPRGRVQ